ncbi:hypothetical protein Cgig2_031623 [Carnegiea gigantea]|uniref:Uncharacterized protein n=1 Tax=Carnegiea gigantea TaxID=171969 RepID=A0A9Q1QDU9_9CARY|nr:hypothetical protein Cgig2_031623 [Carnegiea gigantea]
MHYFICSIVGYELGLLDPSPTGYVYPTGLLLLHSPFPGHTPSVSPSFMPNAPIYDTSLPPQNPSLFSNAQLSHAHHGFRLQDRTIGCLGSDPSNQDLPGLHEVCALCSSNAHDLDACAHVPKNPIRTIVEKFGATNLYSSDDAKGQSQGHNSPISSTKKWVTVSPNKRGRILSLSKRKSGF